MTILLQVDNILFFGRFHPLVVHLPIGFLLLAAALFALSFIKKYSFLLNALPIVLLLGAVSSLIAVVLGWMLSTEGGYDESTLPWHQWMGISVSAIAFIAWLWISGYLTKITPSKSKIGLVMAIVFILISITGHLGGKLTHGEHYLFDHAPAFIQTLFAGSENNAMHQQEFPADPDSIRFYAHIIKPALNKKCTSCHNESKMKGGLLLTTQEGLLKGGENGVVLEKGSSQDSELFKRVCLDPTSKKFMPPKGAPMSYTEIALLKYWINSGMSFDLTITNENIPEEIQNLIQQGYALSTKKKTFIEKEKVAPAPPAALESLRSQGYTIKTLAEGNNFLEVVAQDKLTFEKLEALLIIKDQVTRLDLGQTGMQDSWIKVLAQFTNLTRLNLDNNAITDVGIASLARLTHIESLNLHATQISDTGLRSLARLNSLKRIYVWQTKVTQNCVDSLRNEIPTLVIERSE